MPGQTQSEIRSLLAGAGLAPQHRFGQNFLIDLNLMRKLMEAANVGADDVILEVGPGTGSLTEMLLESGARVVSVEIDRGLQQVLAARLADEPRFTLIAGDALAGKHHLNPEIRAALHAQSPGPGGARKLVANLPYQIATPLLVDLVTAADLPRLAVLCCTIQKEVGERLVAAPRSGAYGPVSILLQLLADVELIATLKPGAFWPRPKIDSVMVRITPHPPGLVALRDIPGLSRFVHAAFMQRRKMLRRIARDWDVPDASAVFDAAEIDADARPEALSPEDWLRLYEIFSSNAAC